MFEETTLQELLVSPERWKLVSDWAKDITPRKNVNLEGKTLSRHAFREILFVCRGAYPFQLAESVYDCPPGTVVFIEPNAEHELGYSPDADGLLHIWLQVLQEKIFARAIVAKRGHYELVPNSLTLMRDEAPTSLYRLWDEMSSTTDFNFFRRRKLTLHMAGILVRLLEHIQGAPREDFGRQKHKLEIMRVIEDYIKTHFHERISLEAIAEKAGYSKYHFSRLFRKYSGMTLRRYIDQLRLSRSRRLEQEGASLKQIAAELGFASTSSLINWRDKIRAKPERKSEMLD